MNFNSMNVSSLQHEIRLLSSYRPELSVYRSLMEKCVNKREFRAAVYVFDKVLEEYKTVSEDIYLILERLHSKSLTESSTIEVPSTDKKTLAPRRRIHKIIKGWRQKKTNVIATQYLAKAKGFLDGNPAHKKLPRLSLARKLEKACHIEFETARRLVTKLKQTGYLPKDVNTPKSSFNWNTCSSTPIQPVTVSNPLEPVQTTPTDTHGFTQSKLDSFFSTS